MFVGVNPTTDPTTVRKSHCPGHKKRDKECSQCNQASNLVESFAGFTLLGLWLCHEQIKEYFSRGIYRTIEVYSDYEVKIYRYVDLTRQRSSRKIDRFNTFLGRDAMFSLTLLMIRIIEVEVRPAQPPTNIISDRKNRTNSRSRYTSETPGILSIFSYKVVVLKVKFRHSLS